MLPSETPSMNARWKRRKTTTGRTTRIAVAENTVVPRRAKVAPGRPPPAGALGPLLVDAGHDLVEDVVEVRQRVGGQPGRVEPEAGQHRRLQPALFVGVHPLVHAGGGADEKFDAGPTLTLPLTKGTQRS
jgi:hypothetical protein